jgi:hypothetical protein
MADSFQAKNELVLNRQLKVQHLAVPFKVVGSATSTSVVLSCDEGGFVFMRSAGVDQITGALDSGENATYTTALSDSGGILQVLVKLRQDYPTKVCRANAKNRITGADYPGYLGSSTGISLDSNGNPYTSLMLVFTLAAFNTSTTIDACLEVDYVCNE